MLSVLWSAPSVSFGVISVILSGSMDAAKTAFGLTAHNVIVSIRTAQANRKLNVQYIFFLLLISILLLW